MTMQSTKSSRSGRPTRAASGDAVAMLKADHREVERWFEELHSLRALERRQEQALRICRALRMHSTLEEEIFYPSFLEATGQRDAHHEAIIEHAGASRLIAEIEQASPGDDYYDARLKVLADMVRHHVKEEERPSGLFATARKAGVDLADLGRQLRNRKQELETAQQGGPARQEAAA
jgi:hypothetical protein